MKATTSMWGRFTETRPSSGFNVVVASIQNISSPARFAKMNKFAKFETVVFDEAHRSISKSYTTLMGQLGLTRKATEDEPVLLGLSATPYKADEAETRWLAGRYQNNRLDQRVNVFQGKNSEDVIRYLQSRKILSHVDHGEIDGAKAKLTKEDIEYVQNFHWLPDWVEREIANDKDRTQRIINEVAMLDSSWQILVFASSVDHAHAISAILQARGISARAISGRAEDDRVPGMRRKIVSEFRSKKIRVLVNFGILREGFDAPSVRAIVVARPVYSPNLYFQMIGRGLRGQGNFGTDRCLILNVKDNIVNFKQKLAYTELDWLW